jgi:hypothetical protein
MASEHPESLLKTSHCCESCYLGVCFRRNKLVNYFSLMLRQRLRPGDEDGDPEDPEEGKTKKSSAGSKKGA